MLISLQYPVNPVVVTQVFGENPQDYARYGQAGHNGIDFACLTGQRIFAAADGVVIKIGFDPGGYGNFISIEHGRFQTIYAHLESLAVRKDQMVAAGEVIGFAGSTGNSSGPHLHFELRRPENRSKAYPQGATDALPYFKAASLDGQVTFKPAQSGDEKIHDDGRKNPEIGKKAKVMAKPGVNLRAEPRLGGAILGALECERIVEVVDVRAEWIAVKVWAHGVYFEGVG